MYPVHMIVEANDIIEGIRSDEDKDFWRIECDMNMELVLLRGASIDVHTAVYGVLNCGAVR